MSSVSTTKQRKLYIEKMKDKCNQCAFNSELAKRYYVCMIDFQQIPIYGYKRNCPLLERSEFDDIFELERRLSLENTNLTKFARILPPL